MLTSNSFAIFIVSRVGWQASKKRTDILYFQPTLKLLTHSYSYANLPVDIDKLQLSTSFQFFTRIDHNPNQVGRLFVAFNIVDEMSLVFSIRLFE